MRDVHEVFLFALFGRRAFHAAVVAALAVSLTACVSDLTLDPARGTGVAVLSLSKPGAPNGAYITVKLRGVTNAKESLVGAGPDSLYQGVTFIELPAGEYEFYAWEAFQIESKYKSSSRDNFSVKFRVTAGKASYLGNMDIWEAGKKYKIFINDKRDKDLPNFHRAAPKIPSDLVVIDLMR